MAFEADVRRCAEAIWGLAPGECQPTHYSTDLTVRELDGLVRGREGTHLIMATVSRRLDKAKEDIKKLLAAEKLERRSDGMPTVKWFITKYQLDAEHITLAKKEGVIALTLELFQQRFFDGKSYLAKRKNAAFGSARNLSDGSLTIPEDEYVSLPISMEAINHAGPSPLTTTDVSAMSKQVLDGGIVVMTAPFGSGKSLTTREIFFALRKKYLSDLHTKVPIAINVRDHWGSPYADEILSRHARHIGFAPGDNLTVAWRAGLAAILIDGFDEIASQVVASQNNKQLLRDARYQALRGVRELITATPQGCGILICGRDHYFNDIDELKHALGLTERTFAIARLQEFTEDQAKTFLERKGVKAALPDWLPRKPLILGYLAHKGLLEAILNIDATKGFGYAWDKFLDLICAREATQGQGGMDAQSLRKILERLACDVRTTSDGRGVITGRSLSEAHFQETNQNPTEAVMAQLQRLPGLTPRESDPTERSFVDQDLLDALQGSAIARMVLEAKLDGASKSWLSDLNPNGVAMATHILLSHGYDARTLIALISRLNEKQRQENRRLISDCVTIAIAMAESTGELDFGNLIADEVSIANLDLEGISLNDLTLKDCTITEINFGLEFTSKNLIFEDCLINAVHGITQDSPLAKKLFSNSQVATYDSMATTNAIIKLDLPPTLKALFTVIRKLYVQSGAGRQVSALKRGLPPGPVVASVEAIIRTLKMRDVVTESGGVVHPIHKQRSRMLQILSEGNMSKDPLVAEIRHLR